MEAPAHIVEQLKAIRSTFELRWNPHAKRVTSGYIDASGTVIQPAFDGRFELWDATDGSTKMRKVMTLQVQDDATRKELREGEVGGFRPPGQWLITLLQMVNPERWDGDPNKMLAALVDRPEQLRQDVADADFDDFAEMVARWGGWRAKPKSKVSTAKTDTLWDAYGNKLSTRSPAGV